MCIIDNKRYKLTIYVQFLFHLRHNYIINKSFEQIHFSILLSLYNMGLSANIANHLNSRTCNIKCIQVTITQKIADFLILLQISMKNKTHTYKMNIKQINATKRLPTSYSVFISIS